MVIELNRWIHRVERKTTKDTALVGGGTRRRPGGTVSKVKTSEIIVGHARGCTNCATQWNTGIRLHEQHAPRVGYTGILTVAQTLISRTMPSVPPGCPRCSPMRCQVREDYPPGLTYGRRAGSANTVVGVETDRFGRT